jgi:hypothetical protein
MTIAISDALELRTRMYASWKYFHPSETSMSAKKQVYNTKT